MSQKISSIRSPTHTLLGGTRRTRRPFKGEWVNPYSGGAYRSGSNGITFYNGNNGTHGIYNGNNGIHGLTKGQGKGTYATDISVFPPIYTMALEQKSGFLCFRNHIFLRDSFPREPPDKPVTTKTDSPIPMHLPSSPYTQAATNFRNCGNEIISRILK